MRYPAEQRGSWIATGPRLDPGLQCHLSDPVDFMLARAAGTWSERVAITDGARQITFGALDAAVTQLAGELRTRLGGGQVVAITSILDIDFVIAYYAVLRSGNVVAVLNPLLRERGLAQDLRLSRARLAFVPPDVAGLVAVVRGELAGGVAVAPLGNGRVALGPGQPAVPTTAAGPWTPDDVACLLFTSGTTDRPKAATLTHRNVTVNALQMAQAHRLTARSVSAVHLSWSNPMHLNAAMAVGATQVLCRDPDAVAAIGLADRHRATHYYSLPSRLIRLATDRRLLDTAAAHLTAIASGGSGLPTATAELLTDHFGVPVFQGYGLAETSPLTHSDAPDDVVHGSVGRPVAETECRIVDLTTRRPVGPRTTGEVQIRGPQLMRGYLHAVPGSHLDAEGWFSTGDTGWVTDCGRLYLTDRTKDVFKRDNAMVSPAAIEARLRIHAAVLDCLVVDYPDRTAGAVPSAFVVLAPGWSAEQLDDIVELANRNAPPHERLEHVELVRAIPRTPAGKIDRRPLRTRMLRRRTSNARTGQDDYDDLDLA